MKSERTLADIHTFAVNIAESSRVLSTSFGLSFLVKLMKNQKFQSSISNSIVNADEKLVNSIILNLLENQDTELIIEACKIARNYERKFTKSPNPARTKPASEFDMEFLNMDDDFMCIDNDDPVVERSPSPVLGCRGRARSFTRNKSENNISFDGEVVLENDHPVTIEEPITCPFKYVEDLMKKYMAAVHQEESNKVEMRLICAGFFNSVAKSLQNILKKSPIPSQTIRFIETLGNVIQKAGPLLYWKGSSNSHLPGLMTATLLPPTIYDYNKSLNPRLANAFSAFIPKVIEGIWCTGDPFVTRIVKDIFNNYIHRYPAALHPFIDVLSDETLKDSAELRKVFLSCCNGYLEKKSDHIKLSPVLALLTELLELRLRIWAPLICNESMEQFLRLLLTVEDKQLKRSLTETVAKILNNLDISRE